MQEKLPNSRSLAWVTSQAFPNKILLVSVLQRVNSAIDELLGDGVARISIAGNLESSHLEGTHTQSVDIHGGTESPTVRILGGDVVHVLHVGLVCLDVRLDSIWSNRADLDESIRLDKDGVSC